MGKSKKYTRRINVNDIIYRYWVDPGNNIGVFAEKAPSNSTSLYFHVPWGGISGDDGFSCSFCRPEPVAITPKDVRHAILLALKEGWDPLGSSKYDYFSVEGFEDRHDDGPYMSRDEFHDYVNEKINEFNKDS